MRLLLFVMLASAGASFAMELQVSQDLMLIKESPKPKVQEKTQEKENRFDWLPDELMMHIFSYLNIDTTASTPKEAVKHLRAVSSVNQRFDRLLSDEAFVQQLMEALIAKFPRETQESPLMAALFLHTAGALCWLNNNDEDWRQQVKTIAQEEACRCYNAPFKLNPFPKRREINPAVLSAWLDIPEFADYRFEGFRSCYGGTILSSAAQVGFPGLVHKLLALGANPNDICRDGSVVYIAAANARIPVLERLLNKGADPNITEGPLVAVMGSYANKNEVVKILEILLNAGANPDSSSPQDYLPLFHAVAYKNEKAIKILLEAGADPEIEHNYGNARKLAEAQYKEGAELIKNSSQLRLLGFIRDERLSYSPEVYRKLGVKPYARPHEILEVKPNATQKEIDAIYKKLTNHYRKLLRTNANDSDIASILSLIEWAYKKVSGI